MSALFPMQLRRLLRRQDGIALVMALGMLIVLTIVGSTALYVTSSNERSARHSGASEGAYSIAEAGIAEAISKLANATDPAVSTLLPSTTVNVGTGTVTYAGVLNGTVWTITSTGKLTNPTGASGQVTRTLTRDIVIQGLDVGSLAGDWDRIHQEASTPCLTVPVDIPARLTTFAGLCLTGGASITGSTTRVSVAGNVTLGAGASYATTLWPSVASGWTNSGNVYLSDNAYATTALANLATSANLDATSYGFNIPSDATINGITAKIEKKTSVANTFQDLNVRLLKNGTPAGNDKAATGVNWGTSDANATYGSAADLWGTTWTPADINNANFGVRLAATDSGTTASSSVKNAGTGTGASWTNPGNVVSSNNQYATQSLTAGTTSGTLDATNFGFTLPSDAVVTGVSARIEKKASVASTLKDLNVYMLKAGSPSGNDKAVTGSFWGTGDAYTTYGAAGDMWGNTLTPADVNSSTFGLRLVAKNFHATSTATASIDHMEMTVYYNAYNPATGSVDYMEITVNWSRDYSHIGTSGTPIASADIVGTCKLGANAAHTPCTSADNVYANSITTSNTVTNKPTVDFNYWFNNAKPGPKYPCNVTSGTPPVFDSTVPASSVLNDSNDDQELTPETADYTCKYNDSSGKTLGELSWNRTTRVLTVKGTIFFDGQAFFHDHGNYIVHYQGRATIWIWDKWHNDEIVCAGGSGSTSCRGNSDPTQPANSTMSSWDPSSNLLVIIANGKGNGDAWDFHINAAFQGILWGKNNCKLHENMAMSGPIICDTIEISSGDSETFWPWPALPGVAQGQIYTNGTKLDKQLILGQQSG